MKRIREIVKNGGLFKMKTWQAVLFLAAASLALTMFMLWLQPDGVYDVMKCLKENNGLSLFLNWLPLALMMFLLYFIGLNPISSAAITGFAGIVTGTVNRFKILLRNDPFLPWDLSLGGEIAGIAKSFGAKMIIGLILAIIVYIVVATLVSMLIKGTKLNYRARIIGAFSCVLIAALLNKPLYKNVELNNNLYVIGNIYNQVNTFNSKGFLYSFIYSYNTNKISKPDGYNSTAVTNAINSFEAETALTNQKTPHLIMIMGEAFSELSLNEHFDFSGYVDPLENYKKIKSESIYGEIVVPNIGGGTADTEFDVLTGLSTRHLRGAPFAFRLVGDKFESIATVLKENGYQNEFLHPGHSWFYNRQNVYNYMGFDKLVFMDEFEGVETKGMYINETATIDRIIEMFENHLENSPDTPYFQYCVTIQNHGPYKDKYLVDTNFSTDLDIAEDDINAISNYFEGVRDADRELNRLVEYFNSCGEPVVLVYFGDHLPAFTSKVYDAYYPDIYTEGSVESLTRLYKTPFIIWENDIAKSSTLNTSYSTEGKDYHPIFSSNYLGVFMLDYLGIPRSSAFLNYTRELMSTYPVITEHKSFGFDGSDSLSASEEDRQKLILYRDWEFYKIFDAK